jgi:MFS transporter, DHA1 family, tetracycline resistance protein
MFRAKYAGVKQRPAVVFILVTVMLDMLGIGLIAPVLPKLILSFLGNNMTAASNWTGAFLTVFALMQFLFSPLLGVLSDRVGRRPVILLSNLGLGLDYFVMAVAPTLRWLFIGRAISGFTASSIPTAMAYITDVTPREKRAGAFGMIGAAFGLGFILGPALGGLLGDANPRLPFWVAGGLSLANALYGFLVLPESLSAEKRKPFTLGRANPLGSLVLLRSHPELFQLATIQFLAYLAHQVFDVWALYAIYRYSWSAGSIGVSLAVVGISTAVISGGLTGRIVRWIGERRALYTGQFFGALGMVMASLARTGAWYIAAIPVISIWNISGPSAQGMMTHRVSEREQGELQGAISSLRSLAVLIGPGLFTLTFSFFIDKNRGLNMPGAPWYLAAALLFTDCLLSTRIQQQRVPVAETIEPLPDVVTPEGVTSGNVAPD